MTDSPGHRPYRSPLLISLALVSLFWVVFFVFYQPAYDQSDDIGMVLVASGADDPNGVGTPYLIFSHIWLGHALRALFAFQPHIPWYGLNLLVLQTAAQIGIVYSILRNQSTRPTVLFVAVWLLSAATALVVQLQFTSTAAIGAVAAWALWMTATIHSNRPLERHLTLVAAFLLGVYSSLVRWDSFLFVGLLASAPTLYLLWKRRDSFQPTWPLGYGVVMVGLAFLCHQLDMAAYRSDPKWKHFREVNREIFYITDYGEVAYTPETKDVFDSVGWSENDFQVLMSRFYRAPHVHDLQTLQTLAEKAAVKQGIHPRSIVVACVWMISKVIGSATALGMTLLCLLLCLHRVQQRSAFWFLMGTLAWILIVFLIMLTFLKLPERILIPGLAFFMLSACILPRFATTVRSPDDPQEPPREEATPVESSRRQADYRINRILLTAVLCLFTAFWLQSHLYRDNQLMRQARGVLQEHLAQLPDKDELLYVVWNPFPFDVIGPLDDVYEFADWQFLWLGGRQLTPRFDGQLATLGITDLPREMSQNPQLRLISHPALNQILETLLAEHYDAAVQCRESFRCPLFRAYEIVPADPPPSVLDSVEPLPTGSPASSSRM